MPSKPKNDLVSVVVPAFGHERFIRTALDSVVDQTYPHIELIVLDDCSKDDTLAVAKQWASDRLAANRFSRMVIERNPVNTGAHETINRGMAMAQGDYITILNSDDAYAPKRLQILVEVARENRASLLFSGVRVIDAEGSKLVAPGLPSEIESMVDFAASFPSLSFALLSKNIAVSTGNLFFGRDLLKRIGNFRPLRYCHDWDFVLRASLITEPVLVPAPLYDYRVHESNSFAALKIEQYLEPQLIYRYFFNSCKAGNCTNPVAPCPGNWPGVVEMIVQEDQNMSGGYHFCGEEHIKLNQIACMIQRLANP